MGWGLTDEVDHRRGGGGGFGRHVPVMAAVPAVDGNDGEVMWHQGKEEEVSSMRIDEEWAERQCSPREGNNGGGGSKCGEVRWWFGHWREREAEGESRGDLSALVWREMSWKRSSPHDGGGSLL
jgi:hypothetical protein